MSLYTLWKYNLEFDKTHFQSKH